MSPEHVVQLSAPFDVNEHEFVQGKIYLTEEAITRRLDEVDPGWTFAVTRTAQRDDSVTIYAALTVCGVTRESCGTDKLKGGVGEPEKSALTDALKRCARLFGIGRYLLDMPKSISDHNAVAAWLRSNYPSPSSKAVSDAEWRDFAKHWKKQRKMSYAEVCTALGVADVRDFVGTLAVAHGRVAQWPQPPSADELHRQLERAGEELERAS